MMVNQIIKLFSLKVLITVVVVDDDVVDVIIVIECSNLHELLHIIIRLAMPD